MVTNLITVRQACRFCNPEREESFALLCELDCLCIGNNLLAAIALLAGYIALRRASFDWQDQIPKEAVTLPHHLKAIDKGMSNETGNTFHVAGKHVS